MKNKLYLLGFIAVLAFTFAFTSCDNGTTTNVFGIDQFPDTYIHATSPASKAILPYGSAEWRRAVEFLWDASHYFHIDMALQVGFGDLALRFPYGHPQSALPAGTPGLFNPNWRSPLNRRVYRGPFFDPLARSVNWLSINPNGSINNSLGSYWALIPPGFTLDDLHNLPHQEIQGFQPSNNWRLATSMAPGQSVNNYIERRRGTFAIDAANLRHYELPAGWRDRNHLFVEVRMTNYQRRVVTPENLYAGWLPTTTFGVSLGGWRALSGWGADAVTPANAALPANERAAAGPARSLQQFWGVVPATVAAGIGGPEWNLNTDAERQIYLTRANNDPRVMGAIEGGIVDIWFDIMQIVNVTQEVGFDYEQMSGTVNGIDRNRDGFLDLYPANWGQALVDAVLTLIDDGDIPTPAQIEGSGANRVPIFSDEEIYYVGLTGAQRATMSEMRAAVLRRGRVILQGEWETRVPYWVFYLNYWDEWFFQGFPGSRPGYALGTPVQRDGITSLTPPAWYTGDPIRMNVYNAAGIVVDRIVRRGTTPVHADRLPVANPAVEGFEIVRPRPAAFNWSAIGNAQ